MGMTAEEVAHRYNISRADQDAFSAESQRRAAAAISSGAFRAEIVPVDIPQKKGDAVRVDTDEYPRPGTTVEKLGALKAAFTKSGSVTAGNASGINDGAAALVVMNHETARQRAVSAARESARLCGQRCRSDGDGHRPHFRGAESARTRKPPSLGDRSL